MDIENCKKIEPVVVKLRSKTKYTTFSEHGVERKRRRMKCLENVSAMCGSGAALRTHRSNTESTGRAKTRIILNV